MSAIADNRSSAGAVKAAHNSAFLLGSQLLTKLSSFFVVIMLARYLKVADFGVYSLALAVTGIMDILAELGLDQLSIREIARNRGNIGRFTANAVMIKLVLTAGIVAVTCGVLFFTGLDSSGKLIFALFTLALIPTGVFHTLLVVFMGVERMAAVAAGNIAFEVFRLLLTLAVLLMGHGLVALASIYLAAYVLSALLMYALVRLRVGSVWTRPDIRHMFSMARASLPFMVYGLFFLVYFKIDFIMLAAMKGTQVVGTYAAAYRLMESLMVVPAAFMGAIFPSLSRLSIAGSASVLTAARRTLRYMAMIGLPIGFGTMILASRIIPLLFGNAYLDSVLPLQIIIWSIVLVFLNSICPVGLNSSDRQLLSVVVTGTGIVVNVAVNLILIPPLGAVGASIATVVTELISTLLFMYFFRRHIGSLRLISYVYRPLAASLVMAASLLVLRGLPLAGLIAAGMGVYLLVLVLLGALGRSDLGFLESILRPAR